MDSTSDLPQDAIISVLAHLHPRPAASSHHHSPIINETDYLADPHSENEETGHTDNHDHHAHHHHTHHHATPLETTESPIDSTIDEDISRWSAQKLRTEVIRLRGILRSLGHDVTPPETRSKKRKRNDTALGEVGIENAITEVQDGDNRGREESLGTSAKSEKERKRVMRDQETGKRVDKGRRLELGKAIRAKVSATLRSACCVSMSSAKKCGPGSVDAYERCDSLWALARKIVFRLHHTFPLKPPINYPNWLDMVCLIGYLRWMNRA